MASPERQFSEAELSALLRSIDHRPPMVGANAVMRRVRARRTTRSALLAACALVSIATIATAASPGTALNGLVRGLMGLGARPAVQSTRPSGELSPAPRAAAARGIAFVPGARVNIVFRTEQSSGELRVRVGNVTSVRLTQMNGGGETRLALTADGVVVGNEGANSSYSLSLPSTAAHAIVRIGGKVVVTMSTAGLSCGGKLVAATSCTVSMRP